MYRFFTLLMFAATVSHGALAQDEAEGADLFMMHCATCHGTGAKGGGPMAPVLLLQPPDLTGLSSRNNGVFPTTRVVMRIDGRDPLVSHGSPMPVYGDFFEGDDLSLKTESGQPILTTPAVASLVAYLRGLQE